MKTNPFLNVMRNLIVKTAIAFGLIGYLLSSRRIILFLNTLNPFQGLLVYYLQIFVVLEVLQYFGLVIGGVKQQTVSQTFGELMIIFAFFILVDMESERIQHVVGEDTKKEQTCPNVYLQAEDGATYYLWKTYVTNDPESLRILTFVITPIVLASIGLYLTGGKAVQRDLLGG
jgi:hypothetical protein